MSFGSIARELLTVLPGGGGTVNLADMLPFVIVILPTLVPGGAVIVAHVPLDLVRSLFRLAP
ncbi:MAG: hypothetical protein WA323_10020 [Candidatus Nitrosopolaris sp.]